MHSPAYAHYLLYLRINYGARPSEPASDSASNRTMQAGTNCHAESQPPTETKMPQRGDT